MRQVLKNHHEVCHFWANRIQNSGNSGNMFFRDDTIFSYGSHFPIARHVSPDTIFFTTRTYSISTAKHISYTRRAIPHDKKVIYLFSFEIDKDTISKNIDDMQGDISEALKKSLRSRFYAVSHKEKALEILENLEMYSFFLVNNHPDIFPISQHAEIIAYCNQQKEEISSGDFAEKIKIKIAEEKRRAKIAEEKKIRENAEMLENWKNGISPYYPRIDTVFLRVYNGNIETTKGARVTISEGKTLWNMIKHNRPIHGETFSGYTVISFDGEILKIGCHIITRDEINRIGAILDTP